MPPTPAAKYPGQLETDTFCTTCHYNLHGQPVMLDERLEIPVCRCPECGKIHPAGVGVSSSNIWLRRLATSLLVVWIVIVLIATFLVGLGMFGLQAGFVDGFVWNEPVGPNGQPLVLQSYSPGAYGYVIQGTTTTIANPQWAHVTQPPPGSNPESNRGVTIAFCTGSAVLGLLAGVLLSGFFWHWPRWRYLTGVILPILASAILIAVYSNDKSYLPIRSWCFNRVEIQSGIQAGALILGALIGRKFIRGLLSAILPPKPRQLFAFLWQVDGKPLPISTRF